MMMILEVGIQVWVTVCAYAPTDERDSEEKERFWVDAELRLDKSDRNDRITLTGDMTEHVGDQMTDRVVDEWGMSGLNNSGNTLVDMCEGND